MKLPEYRYLDLQPVIDEDTSVHNIVRRVCEGSIPDSLVSDVPEEYKKLMLESLSLLIQVLPVVVAEGRQFGENSNVTSFMCNEGDGVFALISARDNGVEVLELRNYKDKEMCTLLCGSKYFEDTSPRELLKRVERGEISKIPAHVDNPDFETRPSIRTGIARDITEQTIEPGILPVVKALNDKGFKTYASCEGHAISNSPYVAFLVTNEEQRAMVTSLMDAAVPLPLNIQFELNKHVLYGEDCCVMRYNYELPKDKTSWTYGTTRERVDAKLAEWGNIVTNLKVDLEMAEEWPDTKLLRRGEFYSVITALSPLEVGKVISR